MGLIQRFLLGNRVDDDLQVGLFLKTDGTVWLRNPDRSETQLPGGGGGLPDGWTQDDDPTLDTVHANTAFEASAAHPDFDVVAFRIRKVSADGGDFVEFVITDENGTDWVKTYNHSTWLADADGFGVFVAGNPSGTGAAGEVGSWVGSGGVSPFAVAAAGADLGPGDAANEDMFAWGIQASGAEFLMVLAEPDDDTVSASQRVQWYDDTSGAPKLRIKERDVDGTLVERISAVLTGDASAFAGIAKADLPADPTNAELATFLSNLGLANLT